MNNAQISSANWMRWLAVVLGVGSFIVVLATHHFADGDLWAKLALGAHVWIRGSVMQQDIFAFAPVLPEYIDHEWGAGFIFYALLKWFGPGSLIVLKIVLALGGLCAALTVGRRMGCDWNSLLALAIPCAACILPGYVPVLRSHTFTYCFFGITLLCLEQIRAGKNWPAFVMPVFMLVWANVHGGFVAGLCTVAVYTGFSLFTRQRAGLMVFITFACLAVTLINPYGLKFWTYLIPALLHKRPQITEWQPLPIFANDAFIGFRILFVLVIFLVLISWRRTEKKLWPGLVMLAVTAVLAWRSRRHAPFFGVAALAFAGPFVASAFTVLVASFSDRLRARIQPTFAIAVLYGLIAIYAAIRFLPGASFQVLAPVGLFPVREVDVLMHAEAEGNLATPFSWGSYATWRLYPRIKISMDGRYEAAFPESSFQLNQDLFNKRGPDWDRLLREYIVDYVILDLKTAALRPEDLRDHGYDLIWLTEGESALMVLQKHAARLREIAASLPNETIDPLDAAIAGKWWPR